MSITRGTVDSSSLFKLANAAPIGGSNNSRGLTDFSEDWTTGTAANQFDKVGVYTFTIAALGTQLIDLQADLGVDGVALSLAELRHLRIRADSTNPAGPVTCEVDATNGFDEWIDTVGAALDIHADSSHGFTCGTDGVYPVDATHKELLLTNTDAADSAIIYVEVVGTSA